MAGSRIDTGGVVGRIVGREPELAAVQRFLEGPTQVLLITGEPGAGKTTVWQAGVDAARTRPVRLLVARPSDAEAQLSFAALADLLADVDTDTLELPAPQRHALEVALYRVEPAGNPPDQFAISAGFLSALRSLADHGPVLVAIDDAQWLDRSTAAVVAYAARRLRAQPVRFLVTRRSGEKPSLEPAFEHLQLERLHVGPLSLGATRALLSERLGLTVTRRVLRQIVETAQGNPLLMLEIGRILAERGLTEIDSGLPLPRVADDLFGARLAAIPEPSRLTLLAIGLAGELPRSQLERIVDPDAIDDALDAGSLVAEGDRVRMFHPLLAAAVREASSPGERRALHAELARTGGDETLRARHMALATDGVDEEVAARVASAAGLALARGASEDAAALAEHALRLTPADSSEWTARLLALAECLEVAGEMERVTRLLAPEVETLAPFARARAHLLLGEASESMDVHAEHLELALSTSAGDDELRATVLAGKAFFNAVHRVERIDEGERFAREALALAEPVGGATLQRALHAVGVTCLLAGRPFEDVVERLRGDGETSIHATSLDLLIANRLGFRGQVDRARELFHRIVETADAHGEARTHCVAQEHLAELELRAGMTRAAAELLEEADEWRAILGGQARAWEAWLRARLAAVEGSDDADRLAEEALPAVLETGSYGDQLDLAIASGLADLLAGDPERAATSFRRVWDHTEREAVGEPGIFPAAPELVEALVQLGQTDEALAVTDRLAALSEEQEHPWGLATTKRCRGLVRLAAGDHGGAAPELAAAAVAYAELGLRFDEARSLLALGRGERRLRKWAAARASLEQAAAVFDEIGATGWADRARSELARVGARRPRAAGELTPSETRVAELAADGLSNKEIAQMLVVSVHTVERHLKHVYSKLGIRSRGQLAQRLRGPD